MSAQIPFSRPQIVQGPDLHRKAFEIWYQTKNKSEAARQCGVTYQTVCRWAESGFVCRWHCEWHNWEQLIHDKERALSALVKQHEENCYDPLKNEQAMRDALGNPTHERLHAIDRVVRSDLERLGHLEFLYAKIYYEITGVSLTPDQILARSGLAPGELEALEKNYMKGLRLTNFESGIRCLVQIMDKIKELKTNLGVIDESAKEEKSDDISLEDLRALRDAHLSKQILKITHEVNTIDIQTTSVKEVG